MMNVPIMDARTNEQTQAKWHFSWADADIMIIIIIIPISTDANYNALLIIQ